LVGWIGGVGSYHLFGRSLIAASDPQRVHSANLSEKPTFSVDSAGDDPHPAAAFTGTVTGKITGPAGLENKTTRRYQSVDRNALISGSTSKPPSIAQQTSLEPPSDNSTEPVLDGMRRRASGLARRVPVPETKPTTIQGWTVRNVYNNTAVLEGPDGVWRVARGDTVPAVGRIDSIVLWGNRWIVATSRGLITTP
jgi:hypothetical protein